MPPMYQPCPDRVLAAVLARFRGIVYCRWAWCVRDRVMRARDVRMCARARDVRVRAGAGGRVGACVRAYVTRPPSPVKLIGSLFF